MRHQSHTTQTDYEWAPRRPSARPASRSAASSGRRPTRYGLRPGGWLVVLLLSATACFLGARSNGGRRTWVEPAEPPGQPPHDGAVPGVTAAALGAAPANPFPADRINLLVLGTDAAQLGSRSDTIILLMVDLGSGRLGAVSVPRDTRVTLPGHGTCKINAAYPLGGETLAAQAVADLTRQPIQYFVRVDLDGFEQVVDLVGGVELSVDKRMRYVDRAQDLRIDLRPGRQRLDGHRAMQYVRFRQDAEADLGRIRRQQKFLRAVASRLASPSQLGHLPEVATALAQHVQTNLAPLQMLRLARLASETDADRIMGVQLPGEAQTIGGVSYFIAAPAAAETVEAVRDALQAPILKPAVTIYNGSDRIGLEQVVARRLAAAGCSATCAPTPLSRTAKSALYQVDDELAATKAAAVLGLDVRAGPAPRQLLPTQPAAEGTARVVLVLGTDFPDE